MPTQTIEAFDYATWKKRDPEVADRILEKHRDIDVSDSWWHETTIEEWEAFLKEAGFDGAKIRFSGFWSQGDGASFTGGRIDFRAWRTIREKIEKQEIILPLGDDKRQEFIEQIPLPIRFDELLYEQLTLRLEDLDSHYCHSHTVRVNVDNELPGDWSDEHGFTPKHRRLNELAEDVAEAASSWRFRLCDWIYRALETEYEFRVSDESVIETLEANEYLFDDGGNIVHVDPRPTVEETLYKALSELRAWFIAEPTKGMNQAEMLLAGCQNHLRADLDRATEALAFAKEKRPEIDKE